MTAPRRDGFQRSRVAAWAGLFLVLATLPVAFARAEPVPVAPPPVVRFVPVPVDATFLGMTGMPADIGAILGPAQNLGGGLRGL